MSPRSQSANAEIARRCPICMENYSETRFPVVAPQCGHSICVNCGYTRNSNICVSCNSRSGYGSSWYNGPGTCYVLAGTPWSSSSWTRNYSLLELINHHAEIDGARNQAELERAQTERDKEREKERRECLEREKEILVEQMEEMKRKLDDQKPNDGDHLACSNCETMEKMERMKICTRCAHMENVDWNVADDEEIIPFVVCAYCIQEYHVGHETMKYLPLKTEKVLHASIDYGHNTISSIDELCRHEIAKGSDRLKEWKQVLEDFRPLSEKMEFRRCLEIENSLREETDLVSHAADETLPTWKMYNKSLRDSTCRLKLLTAQLTKEQNQEEDVKPPAKKRRRGSSK